MSLRQYMRFSRLVSAGAALSALVLLAACGGGGSTTTTPPPSGGSPTVDNTVPIIIDGGPANVANIPFVSIKVCIPGNTTACQTIDHVEVDTGSSGVRILSSALSSLVVLPQAIAANGNPLLECAQFADGYSWGPVQKADVTIGSETASAIPVQIIGTATYNTVPSDCSGTGSAENSVSSFGANGIIGIGPFIQDCGPACVSSVISGTYYSCSSSTNCTGTKVDAAAQVVNPVSKFATDNNGSIIKLPAVSVAGGPSASGTLIFGIGTQSNNGLGSAKVYTINSSSGYFHTTYRNVSYPNSFIDSGSNALYFNDSNIPTCSSTSKTAPGFYCPASTQNLQGTQVGDNAASVTVDFSVANAETLITNNTSGKAFSNLAAPNSDHQSFDWGLPFFFNRSVYTAIENANTPGGVGPYFAF